MKYWLAGMMAAAMVAQPALAVTPVSAPTPQIFDTPGSTALPTWTTAKVFEDFSTGKTVSRWDDHYAPAAHEQVSGNVYLDSFNGTKFLEIDPGSSFSVSFTQPEQFLSFILSSFDSADSITLNFANQTSKTLTGGAVFGNAVSNAVSSTTRVSFDMHGLSGITSINFKDSADCNAFYLGGIAAAAPEPGTWAMMILGFGLVGASLRRRSPARARIAYA